MAPSQKERNGTRDTSVHKVAMKVYFPFIQIGDATLYQLLKAADFSSENNIEASDMCLFIPQARAHARSTPVSKQDDRNAKRLNKDRHLPNPHPSPPESALPNKDPSPALSGVRGPLLTTAAHHGFSAHQRGSRGAHAGSPKPPLALP